MSGRFNRTLNNASFLSVCLGDLSTVQNSSGGKEVILSGVIIVVCIGSCMS